MPRHEHASTIAGHFTLINSLFKPDLIRLDIGTFGFPLLMGRTLELMSRLRRENVSTRILVGMPPPQPGPGTQSLDTLQRIQDLVATHPNVDARTHKESHLKAVIGHYPRSITAIVGGRNLGESSWEDFSLIIRGHVAKSLSNIFTKAWRSGYRPTIPDYSPPPTRMRS